MKHLKEIHEQLEKDVTEGNINSCEATKQMQGITDSIYFIIKEGMSLKQIEELKKQQYAINLLK